MKKFLIRCSVKSGWIIGHPVSFLLLLALVAVGTINCWIPPVVGVVSAAILAAVFGFRQSVILMATIFAKSPTAIMQALLEWDPRQRLAARFALVKLRG